MKYKVFKRGEFEKLIRANGFLPLRTHGSHKIFTDGVRQITLKDDMNPMVCRRLIKEYELKG